jgi:hypothetical protein
LDFCSGGIVFKPQRHLSSHRRTGTQFVPIVKLDFPQGVNYMTCKRFASPIRMIAGLLTGLLFAISAVPLGAQPAHQSHPYYDIAREVKIGGTVSKVFVGHAQGMIIGSHLLLSTPSGEVDASLGRWGLQGKGALSVAPGQQVEVTGVMKTLRDKQVFLVREVKAGGQVYTMRNVHGIAVSPQTRERASQKTAQKGESL